MYKGYIDWKKYIPLLNSDKYEVIKYLQEHNPARGNKILKSTMKETKFKAIQEKEKQGSKFDDRSQICSCLIHGEV